MLNNNHTVGIARRIEERGLTQPDGRWHCKFGCGWTTTKREKLPPHWQRICWKNITPDTIQEFRNKAEMIASAGRSTVFPVEKLNIDLGVTGDPTLTGRSCLRWFAEEVLGIVDLTQFDDDDTDAAESAEFMELDQD